MPYVLFNSSFRLGSAYLPIFDRRGKRRWKRRERRKGRRRRRRRKRMGNEYSPNRQKRSTFTTTLLHDANF